MTPISVVERVLAFAPWVRVRDQRSLRPANGQDPASGFSCAADDHQEPSTAPRRIAWALSNFWRAMFVCIWSALWMSVGAIFGALGDQARGLSVGPRYWAPGLLRVCGVRLDVRGLERVDWTNRYIIVANHQSMADIAALQVGLPVLLRFIAKAELLRLPFLGSYLRWVGMICLDRSNTAASVAALDAQASKVVHDCACIAAFAEGTRSMVGIIQPFKKGAFMLALAARVPIVPVSIAGAQIVLPVGGFKVRPGIIRIDIGKPISTVELTLADRDSLIEETRQAIIEMNLRAGGLGDGRSAASGSTRLGDSAKFRACPLDERTFDSNG